MEFKRVCDLEGIVKLWNRNIEVVYPIDLKLLGQNYENDKQNKSIMGAFENGILVGFVIYKQWTYKSGNLKPNHEIGYINSIIVDINYRNRGIGTKLLEIAEGNLIGLGVKKIRLGSDTYHFFPGIPLECLCSRQFFLKRNYKIEDSFYDLICDISKIKFEKLPQEKCNTEKYKVETLKSQDRKSLMQFLCKSFPGRWYEEFEEFFNIGMEDRDVVVLKDEDAVIGFAHIYDNKSKFIGPSIYWRRLLGENYGGLGPIGIDKDYRKCGLGVFILHKSLEILQGRHVDKMVIDWTDVDILDFYGKFNFMPWKEYKKAVKEVL
ncbi:GNAT family N-acetyltransferase [Clostridium neuense]|uniref:GNAT family N-acetyltransferase n=1 Tax=Clostridium neuense TaxID=1728934 RepID=A0ABW8TH40_9CLOT